MMSLRREIQEYSRACEHLMYAMHESTFSEEERDVIGYYTKEVSQRLGLHVEDKDSRLVT